MDTLKSLNYSDTNNCCKPNSNTDVLRTTYESCDISNANEKIFIRCVLCNARSLKNKLAELHDLLYKENMQYDIISICESWLSNTVSNSMLDPHGEYTILRADRADDVVGGGVCVFIKKYFNVVPIDIASDFPQLECVCFDLFNCSNIVVRIFTVYRTGGPSSNDKKKMNMLISCLNKFCTFDKTSLLQGDLNCPNIDWDNSTVSNDGLQQQLLDAVTNLGLVQLVNEGTRGSNILDIILCNDPFLVSNIEIKVPFSTSDHNCVAFFLHFVSVSNSNSSTVGASNEPSPNAKLYDDVWYEKDVIYIWKRADWLGLETFLNEVVWETHIFFFHKRLNNVGQPLIKLFGMQLIISFQLGLNLLMQK